MAGYSATPLARKLGIQPHCKVSFLGVPSEVKADLKNALVDCQIAGTRRNCADVDFAMIFVKTEVDLRKQFPRFCKQLAPAGMLWVGWPKKTSGVASDLSDREVRRVGLKSGLVDVKVCAVNEVWSGLKFVRRVKDRK